MSRVGSGVGHTRRMPRCIASALAVAGAVAVPLAMTGALAGPLAAGAAALAGWTAVPVPAQPGTSRVALDAVSCASVLDCMAVGSTGGPSPAGALAESWNGGRWQQSPVPGGPLDAVACATSAYCLAVGRGADVWDGAEWSATPLTIPSGDLEAVSCPAAGSCVAVGQYVSASGVVPLAERWDGSEWAGEALPALPSGAYLYGVSCPTVSWCMAVGTTGPPGAAAAVALTWSGGEWGFTGDPGPGSLFGLSCTSPLSCAAVGSYQVAGSEQPLAAGWDGRGWSASSTPATAQPGRLDGVYCTGAGGCTAVGHAGGTLVLHSDGQGWSEVTSPSPGGASSSLDALSCTAVCVAVGSSGAGGTAVAPVAEVSSPPPQVDSVTPAAGPAGGGGQVELSGSGLAAVTSVAFGGVGASFQVESDSLISAAVPRGTAGFAPVTVSGPEGASDGAAVYQYQTPYPYHPLAPVRIADTRASSGEPYAGQSLGPGQTLDVQVAGQDSVPADATAVQLNVTEADSTQASYLTVFPEGTPEPPTSSLNFAAGQARAGLVEAAVGEDGGVSLHNDAGTVDVVVDLEGFVGPSPDASGLFVPLGPVRIADTRPGSGEPYSGDSVVPGGVLNIDVAGAGGVPPTGVSAVAVNLTVTDATAGSYLSAYPAGTPPPLASSVNFRAGQTTANAAVVPVGAGGGISIYNAAGAVDVVVDVTGWFGTAGGGGPPPATDQFTPALPRRVLDTRTGPGPLGPGGEIPVELTGVPAGAAAAVLTVTDADATRPSYLSLWPGGGVRPDTSSLNFSAGEVAANLVVVPVGPGGSVEVYNDEGTTDVVVDLLGWYS